MYCDIPTFGRCCFCMPLRRGVLTFGYVSLVFNLLMLVWESILYHNNNDIGINTFHSIEFPLEATLAFVCLHIVFTVVLIYGTHTQRLVFIKTYYYFSITTLVANGVLCLIDFCVLGLHMIMFMLPFIIAEFVIETYLLLNIRSLIQKLSVSKDNRYENPLQQIVYGEERVEENDVYRDTTVVPDA